MLKFFSTVTDSVRNTNNEGWAMPLILQCHQREKTLTCKSYLELMHPESEHTLNTDPVIAQVLCKTCLINAVEQMKASLTQQTCDSLYPSPHINAHRVKFILPQLLVPSHENQTKGRIVNNGIQVPTTIVKKQIQPHILANHCTGNSSLMCCQPITDTQSLFFSS